jgi:hypothetical protein
VGSRFPPNLSHVAIFYPPSPFSSFAPTHDSTRATQTLSETARLVRRKLDLHHARHQLGSLRPSSSIDGDCQSRGGAVSTSEVTEGGVDALLEKNWARLRRLEELRSERTVKKQQTPSEEENIIGKHICLSLLLPRPSTDDPIILALSSPSSIPRNLPHPPRLSSTFPSHCLFYINFNKLLHLFSHPPYSFSTRLSPLSRLHIQPTSRLQRNARA